MSARDLSLRSLAPLLSLLFLCLSPLLLGAQEAPKRYARVAVEKASIRNLSDEKGVAVEAPAKDSLVAVYGDTTNGWSLVEVPGGFPVCVFGKYLVGTQDEGVYEVTRNAVNIRPGPSSDFRNYPLPQRLHAGDKVRLIEKLDGDKPLAESWVRIWSPPGVRAYIQSSQLKPLEASQNGPALWASALLDAAEPRSVPSIAKPRKPTSSIPAAQTAKQERTQEAWNAELNAARELLRVESKKENPDVAQVRSRFQAFLDQSPPAKLAQSAREGLAQVAQLEEAALLLEKVKAARQERRQEILERQNDVIEAARKKDPLGEVFLARGVLFRRRINDQAPRYFLRFGRKTVAEVTCSSGRYNLEQFAGHQVGVQGLNEPTDTSVDGQGTIPFVDISRIELTQLRR